MIHTLAVANYRSLRNLVVPLGQLTVVTGANGSGKSSLYRALRLLSDTAHGELIGSLAREGGLSSTLWAGPETITRGMRSGRHPVQGGPRKGPIRLQMGFSSDHLSYAIDLGLPTYNDVAFPRDPMIKRETVWAGTVLRPSAVLATRASHLMSVRGESGDWEHLLGDMPSSLSMLGEVADPVRAPEVMQLREQVRSWRFYDHFRSDRDAPARQPQVGTYTRAMRHDGADLAAAWATIALKDDLGALDAAVERAFPGARVSIEVDHGARFTLLFHQPGLLRPLSAAELSDGTLRYLMWVAALLTRHPPELMVINEPETSLHHDLLPALGELIVQASAASQTWVITHSAVLADALSRHPECEHLALKKTLGETEVAHQNLLTKPSWRWPKRSG